MYICPPWNCHRSCSRKALCYGQRKNDTQIETERRKKDEGSYADQEALDDRMTLLPLCWIVCVGVRFGCAESIPPKVERLPPRVKRCPSNKEDLGPVLVCVLLKKLLDTSGTCLQKAALLHGYIFMASPSSRSMYCHHTAWCQWKLSPKYRKPPCSGVLSSHSFCCKAITHCLSGCCVKLARFQPWKSGLVHQSLQIFWQITGWVTCWLHQADSCAYMSKLI